ncbi:MAG: glutamate racemase [Acidobacteriota bacterium]
MNKLKDISLACASRLRFCLLMFLLLAAIFFVSCSSETEQKDGGSNTDFKKFRLVHEIKSDPKSPFHINFNDYPCHRESLPIGVFDSGTGGLTVLNAILEMDEFDNHTHEKGSDGIPDFISEKFIYLGDRANMPYGRYSREGKTDFLQELIIKDVQFLLSDRYFISPKDKKPLGRKSPVKAVVIACNTATAYGFELIQQVIREWDLGIKTIGIIEAGAKEAVPSADLKTRGVIGVFATEGTCDSGGYIRALRNYCPECNNQKIAVVQQPCFGLAGAVDGDQAYVVGDLTEVRGPEYYQGPRIGHQKYPIDLSLWEKYNFEQGSSLLVNTDKEGNITEVELNSIENYIKYYVTNLAEKALKEEEESLYSVILGCTHYALFKQEFKNHFLYLRSIDKKYKELIPEDLKIIDPAKAEAMSLYMHLREKNLFGQNENQESQFFLSFPNPYLETNQINSRGEFPIDYKYGRFINQSFLYVKRIPLTQEMLSKELILKLKNNLPYLHKILSNLD